MTPLLVSENLPFVPTYQARVLDALGDGTRRSIVELLAQGPHSVVQIASVVPISRPAVSQHLRVLRDARLVDVRAEGTRRIYSLDPRGLAAARDYFERFWSQALASYAQAVSEHPQESTARRSSEEEQR